MSRYVYQNVHFISSSEEDEKEVTGTDKGSVRASNVKSSKRRRPHFMDLWKIVSPLKYLSTSEEEKDIVPSEEKSKTSVNTQGSESKSKKETDSNTKKADASASAPVSTSSSRKRKTRKLF